VTVGSRGDRVLDSLPPGLLIPSRRYAIAAIARNGGFYLAALASVPMMARSVPWLAVAVMPLLGLAMYRLTMVMHDCVHGTLFVSSRANRIVGAALGACSGIEFTTFSRLHRQHHRRPGYPDDPQGSDYLFSHSPSRLELVWHLSRPLLGYNVCKLWQVYATFDREPDGGSPILRAQRFGLVVIVQLIAAAVASGGLASWPLTLLPFASAATFGLFFAQLRGFAEHVAMPGTDSRGHVRSHCGGLLDRILLYDLNFNLHREHHLCPAVPSCHLPELQRLLTGLGEPAGAMFGTILRRVTASPPRVKTAGGPA
jgi:omega-6 fatty acid desaturase (delta-12 desaturase)